MRNPKRNLLPRPPPPRLPLTRTNQAVRKNLTLTSLPLNVRRPKRLLRQQRRPNLLLRIAIATPTSLPPRSKRPKSQRRPKLLKSQNPLPKNPTQIPTTMSLPLRNKKTEDGSAAKTQAKPSSTEEETTTADNTNNANADGAFEGKVFVGGLPYEADEETLKKDFGECGEIVEFKMLNDESGSFKGICFVTYADQAGVDACLKYDGTQYGSRWLKVNMANSVNSRASKGEGKKGGKGARTPGVKPEGCTTIIIKGLQQETTAEMLQEGFGSCGGIVGCRVIYDRETGESKCVAFMDFEATEGVDEAIKLHSTEVAGTMVYLDYAENSKAPGGKKGGDKGGKKGGKKGDGKKGKGKKGDGKKGKGKGKKGTPSSVTGGIVEATGTTKTFSDSE